jgi:hypothetical protein
MDFRKYFSQIRLGILFRPMLVALWSMRCIEIEVGRSLCYLYLWSSLPWV